MGCDPGGQIIGYDYCVDAFDLKYFTLSENELQEAKSRCMQQLIVTTGEFHSTNTLTPSDEGRDEDGTIGSGNSTDYKAVVYFFLSGGLDSYNMLAPYTCAPIGKTSYAHS